MPSDPVLSPVHCSYFPPSAVNRYVHVHDDPVQLMIHPMTVLHFAVRQTAACANPDMHIVLQLVCNVSAAAGQLTFLSNCMN